MCRWLRSCVKKRCYRDMEAGDVQALESDLVLLFAKRRPRFKQSPRTGWNPKNRETLGDITSNHCARPDSCARTDVQILQNLCAGSDDHAAGNICPRINYGAGTDTRFMSQSAAEIA